MYNIFDIVENTFYAHFDVDKAYWLFADFKEWVQNPATEKNTQLCMELAIKNWENR